jgi:hypothetical protein
MSVIMLSDFMLSVVMLSAFMLIVVAPINVLVDEKQKNHFWNEFLFYFWRQTNSTKHLGTQISKKSRLLKVY